MDPELAKLLDKLRELAKDGLEDTANAIVGRLIALEKQNEELQSQLWAFTPQVCACAWCTHLKILSPTPGIKPFACILDS